MKFVLELSITADGVQDYDDLSERMQSLMRFFDTLNRDGEDVSIGDGGSIFDRNGNGAGKWEIVP